MLLVDDILSFPVRSILWLFREIHKQACEEVANEPEAIAHLLRSLYMQLETSAISEEEFETQEKELLDRLDEIETRSGAGQEEELLDRLDEIETRSGAGQEEEELWSEDVLEEATAREPSR
jgi:hypothetical protein